MELVCDKRNFGGPVGTKDIILGKLGKRVHRTFPDVGVRIRLTMTLLAIDTDASKREGE